MESHCLENSRKVDDFFFLFLSLLVFAGKCLDGRGKSRARVRKEKASERRNLGCLLAKIWIHFEVVNHLFRRVEGEECRNNGVKDNV